MTEKNSTVVEDAAKRKYKELKRLTKTDDDIVIKSPILNDPKTNPCIKEQNLTMKCFLENDYDKVICKDAIENYKLCKDFWNRVYYARWKKGIKPYLPPVEDRPEIMKHVTEGLKDVAYGNIPIYTWFTSNKKEE